MMLAVNDRLPSGCPANTLLGMCNRQLTYVGLLLACRNGHRWHCVLGALERADDEIPLVE